jgi:hypothetical protein
VRSEGGGRRTPLIGSRPSACRQVVFTSRGTSFPSTGYLPRNSTWQREGASMLRITKPDYGIPVSVRIVLPRRWQWLAGGLRARMRSRHSGRGAGVVAATDPGPSSPVIPAAPRSPAE